MGRIPPEGRPLISAAGVQIHRGRAHSEAAEATRALFVRHAPALLRFCRRELGSREEAEDALQATFLNAFRALRRGVVPETETAWLFTIARNVCLERARARRRRGRIEIAGEGDRIDEVAVTAERRYDELLRLPDAFASMPERQREAIVLREWRGLSYGEIGERLHLSQSAVETLLFRARRSLAEGLEKPPLRQRLRKAFDLSWLAGAMKGLGAGSAAVKGAAAVAVVVAAGSVAGGSSPPQRASEASAATPQPASAAQPAPVVPVTGGNAPAASPILRAVARAARSAQAPILAVGADLTVTQARAEGSVASAGPGATAETAATATAAAVERVASRVGGRAVDLETPSIPAARGDVPGAPPVGAPPVGVPPVGVPPVGAPPVAVPPGDVPVPEVLVPALPTPEVPAVDVVPVPGLPALPPLPPLPPVDIVPRLP